MKPQGKSAAEQMAAPAPPARMPDVTPDATADAAANRRWVEVADSKDPAVLRDFISDFPQSPLVALAKRR